MIEVELKLKVENFPNLESLDKIKEKRILDIYYDTEDYKLLIGGNFLRIRNNESIDFKLNVGDNSHLYCKETNFEKEKFSQYKQIEEIFNSIGVQYNSNYTTFEEFLNVNKLLKLAVVDKHRVVYKVDDLEICYDKVEGLGKFIELEMDFDENADVDFGNLKEVIFSKFKEIAQISDFSLVNIGYVELYLKQYNKKAYELGKFKD